MYCPICDGTGDIDFPIGDDPEDCFRCDGSGQIGFTEWLRFHLPRKRHLPIYTDCPCCDGSGYREEEIGLYAHANLSRPCHYCDETGFVMWFAWLKWHYWIVSPPPPLWKLKQLSIWWRSGEWVK